MFAKIAVFLSVTKTMLHIIITSQANCSSLVNYSRFSELSKGNSLSKCLWQSAIVHSVFFGTQDLYTGYMFDSQLQGVGYNIPSFIQVGAWLWL